MRGNSSIKVLLMLPWWLNHLCCDRLRLKSNIHPLLFGAACSKRLGPTVDFLSKALCRPEAVLRQRLLDARAELANGDVEPEPAKHSHAKKVASPKKKAAQAQVEFDV